MLPSAGSTDRSDTTWLQMQGSTAESNRRCSRRAPTSTVQHLARTPQTILAAGNEAHGTPLHREPTGTTNRFSMTDT